MKLAAIAFAGLIAFAAPSWADDTPAKDAAPSAAADTDKDKTPTQDETKAEDLGSFSIPAADGDSAAKDDAQTDSKK